MDNKTKKLLMAFPITLSLMAGCAADKDASVAAPEIVNPDPLVDQYPDATAIELVRGPYLQNVAEDGVTLMWEAATACAATVEYRSEPYYGYSVSDVVGVRHELRLENIRSDYGYAAYRIRCLAGDDVSAPTKAIIGEWTDFSLVPKSDRPFSFVVWGDSQSNPEIFGPLADMMADLNPDLAFNVGDATTNGFNYDEWNDRLFNPAASLLAKTPFYMSIGNHEMDSDYFYELLSIGPHENYHAFKYANAFFIILDTNGINFYPNGPQMEWLEKTVKSDEAQSAEWLILFNHQPAWCEGWGHDGYDGERLIRSYLVPIIEEYGIDMVFNGHAHDYERGEKDGTTYIITGGGGGGLDHKVNEIDYITVYEPVHHFTHVAVDGNKIVIEATDLDGAKIDNHTLEK